MQTNDETHQCILKINISIAAGLEQIENHQYIDGETSLKKIKQKLDNLVKGK